LMCSCSDIPNLAVLRVNKTGLPGQKNLKRPNLSISSFKKAKSSNMKKGQIPIFFKNLLKRQDSNSLFSSTFKEGQIIFWQTVSKRPNGIHAVKLELRRWHPWHHYTTSRLDNTVSGLKFLPNLTPPCQTKSWLW